MVGNSSSDWKKLLKYDKIPITKLEEEGLQNGRF